MWGGSAAFYAGMKVVTQIYFPSSSCKARLGRVFRLAQHGMDILRAHTQSIQKTALWYLKCLRLASLYCLLYSFLR